MNKTTIIGGVALTDAELEDFTAGTDYPPEGFTQHQGVYTGEEPELNGMTALVAVKLGVGTVYAQFDHPSTKKCFGWWKFPFTAFLLRPDVEEEDADA